MTYYQQCPSEHLGVSEWSSNVWVHFTRSTNMFRQDHNKLSHMGLANLRFIFPDSPGSGDESSSFFFLSPSPDNELIFAGLPLHVEVFVAFLGGECFKVKKSLMPPPKQNKNDLSWSHILPQNHEPAPLLAIEPTPDGGGNRGRLCMSPARKLQKLNSNQWWSNDLYLDLLKIVGDRQIFGLFFHRADFFKLGGFPKYRWTCQVKSFDITLILAVCIYHTWMF